jgi:uncharacterized protein (TIGR03643 family)
MPEVKLVNDFESAVIRMAWEDRTSFDEIKARTGLSEAEVIALMRRCLKASSFRMWRKRVSGRASKHRKRLAHTLKAAYEVDTSSPDEPSDLLHGLP